MEKASPRPLPSDERDRRATQTQRPRVGVGILVIDDFHRVLLSLRRRRPEVGAWSILGGRVEPFERVLDCAVREAREEAGVTVEIVRLLCVTDHILPEEDEHWVSPAYLARIREGNPENMEPEKALEVKWFPLTDLPAPLTMTARAAIASLGSCITAS